MIRFVVVLLGALCLTLPAVAQQAADGAELFRKRCSRCHASAARMLLRLPQDPAIRRAALSTLLARHHGPDEAERAALIDWLVAQ